MVANSKGEDLYYCSYCNNRSSHFYPWPDFYDFPGCQYEMWNKESAICPVCFPLDRERLYRFYIERETDLLEKPKKLLHIAPERNLRAWLKGQMNISYVCGDLLPKDKEMEQIDVTAIPFENETFDVIICSHVLIKKPWKSYIEY